MADIRPFKAVRPSCDMADRIASLPYDVYSRAEAYEITRGDEHSFLRIDRPETQFGPDHDMYAPEVYAKAGEMLRDQIASGEFVKEENNCFYVYSQTMGDRTQTGIVALSSVQDYLDNVIKKHENTRAEKELDRIKHVNACNAQTGPIFLAYRKSDVISGIVEKTMNTPALYDFVNGNVRQRVWIISESDDINTISSEFSGMDSIYIADGHHRCASACRVAVERRKNACIPEDTEAEHFLSVLFPDDELMIMDYNRVLKNTCNVENSEFIKAVSKVYSVEKTGTFRKPAAKGECAMYIGKEWYSLKYDQSRLTGDPVKDLDVAVLQDKVFQPVLGIKDPRTDERLDFVGGIRGIEELERRCAADCFAAFAMYPTSIQELFKVADAGLLMPPKSTWFEPKLLSGLFIHEI